MLLRIYATQPSTERMPRGLRTLNRFLQPITDYTSHQDYTAAATMEQVCLMIVYGWTVVEHPLLK